MPEPLHLFGDEPEVELSPLGACWRCTTPTIRRDRQGRPECYSCRLVDDAKPDDPETSRQAAAAAARGSKSPLAVAILGELRERGHDGATDDELVSVFETEHPGSVSKRRADLCAAGLVVDSGRTRATRRGRQAVVWCASTAHTFGGAA